MYSDIVSELTIIVEDGFKLAPSRLVTPPAAEVCRSPVKCSDSGVSSNNGESKNGAVTYNFTPLSCAVEKHENKCDIKSTEGDNKAVENSEISPALSVFGENLADKVTSVPTASDTDITINETEDDGSKTGPNWKFVTSSIFSNCVSNNEKTLSESAAEFTETQVNKRKYDLVDVVTGEEEESNVLQTQVKLYIFQLDKEERRTWIERGQGTLRLNDDLNKTDGETLKSRIVMRTNGNMRVVLNSKLCSNMICEKASERSLRISALDEGEVKIFLISCAGKKEADMIYQAVDFRIKQLIENEKDDDEEEECSGLETAVDGDHT